MMNACFRAVIWNDDGEIVNIVDQEDKNPIGFVEEIIDNLDRHSVSQVTIKECGYIRQGTPKTVVIQDIADCSRKRIFEKINLLHE